MILLPFVWFLDLLGHCHLVSISSLLKRCIFTGSPSFYFHSCHPSTPQPHLPDHHIHLRGFECPVMLSPPCYSPMGSACPAPSHLSPALLCLTWPHLTLLWLHIPGDGDSHTLCLLHLDVPIHLTPHTKWLLLINRMMYNRASEPYFWDKCSHDLISSSPIPRSSFHSLLTKNMRFAETSGF